MLGQAVWAFTLSLNGADSHDFIAMFLMFGVFLNILVAKNQEMSWASIF